MNEVEMEKLYKKVCAFDLMLDGVLYSSQMGIPIPDFHAAVAIEFYADIMEGVGVLTGMQKSEEAKNDGC